MNDGDLGEILKAVEFTVVRYGVRCQANGAIIYNDYGLRIERDHEETRVTNNGELVLFLPRAGSSRPLLYYPGDADWGRKLCGIIARGTA